jgi:hypothetical protein
MRVVRQFRLVDNEIGRGERGRSPAALISRRFSAISRRQGVVAPGKKKRRIGEEGACRSASLRGNFSARTPLGGWGAIYTERGAEPNHRGSVLF